MAITSMELFAVFSCQSLPRHFVCWSKRPVPKLEHRNKGQRQRSQGAEWLPCSRRSTVGDSFSGYSQELRLGPNLSGGLLRSCFDHKGRCDEWQPNQSVNAVQERGLNEGLVQSDNRIR